MTSIGRLGTRSSLSSVIHYIDAKLAWASGVVSGMQDMAQTIDEVNCKLPDFYMYKTMTCACGDTAVGILSERTIETEYAHWCTGSLKMLDGFGRITFMTNPYTFSQLKAKMGNVYAYLLCLSQKYADAGEPIPDCARLKPYVPNIDDMSDLDVMSIAVLSRCRANYQQKRWDEGAYKYYETNPPPQGTT
jgi:hypothetical protein